MQHIEIRKTMVPRLGLGTWQLKGPACRLGVQRALGVGYRHIDTAQAYDNEEDVGAAIAASGVPRSELFVTTKVSRTNLRRAAVRASTERSLARLGLDYVDLLLIHWPNPSVPLNETLEAMLELREERLVREIGVSNFSTRLLSEALAIAPIFCNQIEYHPFIDQRAQVELARREDCLLVAYSPLARGRAASERTLRRIAQAHGRTPSQVALRWLIQQDHVAAIPKSSGRHLEENWNVFDFALTDLEMRQVFEIHRGERPAEPAWAPDFTE
jgi:diketogulonate reductase-like aldo/keto reductase